MPQPCKTPSKCRFLVFSAVLSAFVKAGNSSTQLVFILSKSHKNSCRYVMEPTPFRLEQYLAK